MSTTQDEFTRTWIRYNRPRARRGFGIIGGGEGAEALSNGNVGMDGTAASGGAVAGAAHQPKGSGSSTPEHAGFLLAMGLQGHLRHGLRIHDAWLYLDAGHNMTIMAILLGEAATHRGSMDLGIRKMLCLHIPTLLSGVVSEYDHAPAVQNAAIIGIGLLYMGTVHRLMAEFLIGEIGRRPVNDRGCVDRESYALSAGMALGLLTLGQGGMTGPKQDDDEEDKAEGVDEASKDGGQKEDGGSGSGKKQGGGRFAYSAYQGLADLRLEDRLHHFMVGGSGRTSYSNSEVHWMANDNRYALDRNGIHFGRGGGLRGVGGALRSMHQRFGGSAVPSAIDLSDPISGGGGGATAKKDSGGGGDGNGASSCSRIFEGPQVNIDVTSGGATIALGLMYLKTGNAAVADRLRVPQTLFLLDYVRPDLLLLRQMCLGLVTWDAVRPSLGWISAQVPLALRKATFADDWDGDWDTAAAAAGGGGGGAAALATAAAASTANISKVDLMGYAQAHANITAGAVMAIGLRFAGTANETARETLSYHVRRFKAMLNRRNRGKPLPVVGAGSAAARFANGVADAAAARAQPGLAFPPEYFPVGTRADRVTLEMCLGVAANALAMVMAGTGELDTLRLLRELRLRQVGQAESKGGASKKDGEAKKDEAASTNASAEPGKYATYGNHQAIASAVGLLFLGGGRATLSRSNEAIAALVIAFFPRYPLHQTDNRYHLQALRHLYVLAVDYRVVQAVDVDTGQPCLAPVRVEYKGGNVERRRGKGPGDRMMAPCLLPSGDRIAALRVEGERHWPVTLSGRNVRLQLQNCGMQQQQQGVIVYVKRRRGFLPYEEDPYGQRGLVALGRTGGRAGAAAGGGGGGGGGSGRRTHGKRAGAQMLDGDMAYVRVSSLLPLLLLMMRSPSHTCRYCLSLSLSLSLSLLSLSFSHIDNRYHFFYEDNPEALWVVHALRHLARTLPWAQHAMGLASLRMVLSLCGPTTNVAAHTNPPRLLLPAEFVESLRRRVREADRERAAQASAGVAVAAAPKGDLDVLVERMHKLGVRLSEEDTRALAAMC